MKIMQRISGKVLFECDKKHLRETVEEAVKNDINLTDADLTYAILTDLDLRGADLTGVDFTDADFRGVRITKNQQSHIIEGLGVIIEKEGGVIE